MKKNRVIAGVFFILGLITSFYSERYLRELVFNLYEWTSNNKVQFIGKRVFFFSPVYYYISFGITAMLLYIDGCNKPLKQKLQIFFFSLSLFAVVIIGVCAIDAQLKIVECTSCTDGLRQLKYNAVNYGLIITVALLVCGVPSWIRVLSKK